MTQAANIPPPRRRAANATRLLEIYNRLFAHFGPQRWWPAETACEMIVGAVLTQNTAWRNVEKAIAHLRARRLLDLFALHNVADADLADAIRPSGFFNLKTRRLKALVGWIVRRHGGSFEQMFSEPPAVLREELLTVEGIGPETADSILLYAGQRPIFVIDAYTRRIFLRHGFIEAADDYSAIQRIFMKHLPHDAALFNEYHALIVRTAKDYCKKREPDCAACPLSILPRWL